MLLEAQPGGTKAAGLAPQRKRPGPGLTVVADDGSSDEEGRAVGAPTAGDAPAEPHDEEPPGATRKKLRRSEPAPPGYRIGRKKPSPTAAAAAGAFSSTHEVIEVIDLEAASQVQCACSAF